MNNWLNKAAGLELSPIESDWQFRGNENAILYLVVLYTLKYINNELTLEDIDTFNSICLNLRTYDSNGTQIAGLFDRGSHESDKSHEWYVTPFLRRSISHDNITAISAFSAFFNLPFANSIATYGLSNQFRFDNGSPDVPRWLYRKPDGSLTSSIRWHPRDLFYWLYNSRYSYLSYPFFPIFFIDQILACFSPLDNTSSKQLLFIRLALMSRKSSLFTFTWKICNFILRKRYDGNWIKKIFDIYYPYEDHPIPLEAEKINYMRI